MLKTTETLTITVKAKSNKTGKTYTKSFRYAKRILTGKDLGFPKTTTFLLRENKSWKEVSLKKYREGTSQEELNKIYRELQEKLIEEIPLKEGEKS